MRKNQRFGTIKVAMSMALAATGCVDMESVDSTEQANESTSREVKVLTPQDMTNRSGHYYENNKWGLITADTLKGWLDDWQANKPSHVQGRLYVMQMGDVVPGDDTKNFIRHDDVNTFTYDRTDACNDIGFRRSDGVSEIANAMFTGEYMDMAFWSYGIDPTKDFIVLVLGPADVDLMPGATRSWFQLHYWGWPDNRVAVLNGAAGTVFHPAHNPNVSSTDEMFVASPSDFQFSYKASIRDIRRDATASQATLGDMISLAADPTGAMILDARSPEEYAIPNRKGSKAEDVICGPDGNSQCFTAFEGHIKGASNLPFTNLLNTSDQTVDVNGDGVVNTKDSTFTFKTVPELEALYAGAGYDDGEVIHTYCRTGARATVTTFAASGILGYPARMYDGSWIQWGKLANVADHNGDLLLPADSPWRTDVASASNIGKVRNATDGGSNSNLYVQHHAPGVQPYAADSEAMIREDKAYKQ